MKKRNRKNPMRSAVQVRMTDEMYEWLEKIAERDKKSPADVIRELLETNKSNLQNPMSI